MEHHPLAPAGGESVQAPTTNLSSNDPWRSTESPQAPKTPRLVLECEKSSRAEGDPGKHREKDSRGRRQEKPDTATTAAPHLRYGPAHTRKASTPGMDRQTRYTGKTPPRHPDHA